MQENYRCHHPFSPVSSTVFLFFLSVYGDIAIHIWQARQDRNGIDIDALLCPILH